MKQNQKKTAIEVNRDILASLLGFFARHDRPVDFAAALKYPLSPVPLSLATGDGARRETSKSKLLSLLLCESKIDLVDPRSDETIKEVAESTYVIDLISAVRTMVQIPDTYEQLTWKLIGTFPKGFQRVDIVADTYQAVSIKSGERQSRGTSAKVIIGSPQSKIPRDFNQFMTNGDNKARLVEIICDVLSSIRLKTFRVLKCQTVFFF